MAKEAQARLKINELLKESGWRLIDSLEGRANVSVETNIVLERLGDDFEKAPKGYVDYLLLDEKSNPLCVLEAKSEDKDPLDGKEQARNYADAEKVRLIILSNGNIHYYWDKETGNPTRISHFPKPQSLLKRKEFIPDTVKLAKEEVKEDYIAKTQLPGYERDPQWKNASSRSDFARDKGLRFLRKYQLDAIRKLQKAVSDGKNRFLFEMATGTGKTLVAGAIIQLYMKTKNANRVLFLVDRLELEEQARANFKAYLPDFTTVIYKEKREDWMKADIVVTTIQSISYEAKYLKLFSPSDFDLIISDEAHRSISGNNRTVFDYFIGAKLGLTATPKDYLKNVNTRELNENDPRQLEKRLLLSTYETFGCASGEPTFRYSLLDGVKDGYLINPLAIDCRTDITTELLSDKGYAVMTTGRNDEEEEQIFTERDFERKFFSEKTNAQFAETFLKNGLKDPISGEIGKTIFFCVSRKHASKMTEILNQFAMEMYPGKYNSDFAIQVTSNVQDAQSFTIAFRNNNLRGHTKFLDGYKSSKARVCVTVGMMTTGYDCEDLLNICMARPIFSPTDFVQMRGRGTRTFQFKFKETRIKKERFKLFDFFANCDYFENEFPYDEILELPKPGYKRPGGEPPAEREKITLVIPDPLKTIVIFKPTGEAWKIDKELYASTFEKAIIVAYNKTKAFKEAVDSGNYETMEAYVREQVFDKPEHYFSLQKLRESYGSERRLNLWEILDKALGKITGFKTKENLAEEEFEKFKVANDIKAELYYEAKQFFMLYLLNEKDRAEINKQNFTYFAADSTMFSIFNKLGQDSIKLITEYIKDNVPLNNFV